MPPAAVMAQRTRLGAVVRTVGIRAAFSSLRQTSQPATAEAGVTASGAKSSCQ